MESGEMVGVVDLSAPGSRRSGAGIPILFMIAAPHRNRGLGAAVVGVDAAIRRTACGHTFGVQVNNPDGIRFGSAWAIRFISGRSLRWMLSCRVSLVEENRVVVVRRISRSPSRFSILSTKSKPASDYKQDASGTGLGSSQKARAIARAQLEERVAQWPWAILEIGGR
jgi:hypothetical protein